MHLFISSKTAATGQQEQQWHAATNAEEGLGQQLPAGYQEGLVHQSVCEGVDGNTWSTLETQQRTINTMKHLTLEMATPD